MSASLLTLAGQFNFRFLHAAGNIIGEMGCAGVRRLHLLPRSALLPPIQTTTESNLSLALTEALRRYFAGTPESFGAVTLDISRGSPFQQAVWQAAREVPWGTTETYGALAGRLGRTPGSSRAIGHALGLNPLHLLIPCHRFLGANGSLVDYAGGLDWKQTLLRIEGSYLI